MRNCTSKILHIDTPKPLLVLCQNSCHNGPHVGEVYGHFLHSLIDFTHFVFTHIAGLSVLWEGESESDGRRVTLMLVEGDESGEGWSDRPV